jgi:predicted DNA-binding transcriptional regulator YafY
MARGDQLSRQWKIIQSLIASPNGKSAGRLAREIECHSRTLYRDLEALQAAGFPLYSEQAGGKALWFILDAGINRMPLPLNLTELMALYFSRNMLKVLQGTAIYDSLAGLFEKVKATLPPGYIDYLDKLAKSLEVGVKAYKPYRHFQNILAQVNQATQEQLYIDIDYFSMGRRKSTKRRIAPYKVWFYDETFYVIGYCGMRQAVRIFAVDRIESLSICKERFEIPLDFDTDTFMQSSFGVYQGDPVQVRIRFTPEVAGYIREKIWHPSQTLSSESDGGLIFGARVAGIEDIKYWVLKWGAGAEVLEPDTLRSAICVELQNMLSRYQPMVDLSNSPTLQLPRCSEPSTGK